MARAEIGQDVTEEQSSLILIEELQAEMRNLRAEVRRLAAKNNRREDEDDDDNEDDVSYSRTSYHNLLSVADDEREEDIYEDNPEFGTRIFVPEGNGNEDDTNESTIPPPSSTSPRMTPRRRMAEPIDLRGSITIPVPPRRNMTKTASVLMWHNSARRSVIGGDEDELSGFALDHDTFTLMTISRVGSYSWSLGACSFCFQMILASQILVEQILLSVNSSTFNVPFKVSLSVRLAQFLSIALALAMQSDIFTSVRAFLVLGERNSNWISVIGRQGERKSYMLWLIYVLFPNLLKFSQGFLVLTTCLVVIVQADDIVALLKDFTALMIVSEIDNVIFGVAAYGYLGEELHQETERIKDICIIHNTNNNTKEKIHEQRLREIRWIRAIYILVLSALLSAWITVIVRQENGTFFQAKFPKCGIENFQLAKKKFGDGKCYGGALNTLACKFEDGDCVQFNIAYPECRGFDNLTNVEELVGDGNCDPEFAMSECAWDGGDCPF